MNQQQEKTAVTAREVRAWALKKGIQVGQRGHMPQDVYDRFNRAHRSKRAVNNNPSRRPELEG